MSLDVYLTTTEPVARQGSGIFIRRNGSIEEITREEWDEMNPGHEPTVVESKDDSYTVFDYTITHNLNKMASAAGIYTALWRPGEDGITKASQLVEPLAAGLARLKANPGGFKAFNPPNGWGDYDGLVKFVEAYLAAAIEYPEAEVRVSR